MIYGSVDEIVLDDVFLALPRYARDLDVTLKIEGLNPAGSVKLKTAVALVDDAERRGLVDSHTRFIESSSGNLGIALAMVCAARNYPLTVVTDPNASPQAVRIIRALDVELVEVVHRDANGGYLASRIDYVRERVARDPRLVWLNQYANRAGVEAHARRTARAIDVELGPPDYLFVGAGTTGTLMGCAEYFRARGAGTKVVAVDAVGSITFGGSAGPRHIPGLGSSRRPEIFSAQDLHRVVAVAESATIRTCRDLARRYGLLAGGSTGTVLAAVAQLADEIDPAARVVALSPDLGDRYAETVYDDGWVAARFTDIIDEPRPIVAVRAGSARG